MTDDRSSCSRTPSEEFFHNVRTPLTVIRMQTQLLLRRAQAGPLDQEGLVQAIEQIDRQVVMIGHCLDQAEQSTNRERAGPRG